jgi:predicted Zn-dependent protease
VGPARADELRQGPAGPARPRLARDVARALPERPGRSPILTLELAERALEAARGDEADAVVQAERSGLARFAGSEVHQPTLIENASVLLRICRDGRVGVAAGNRVDEEGLRELARRARVVADAAPPNPDFPGLARPAELPPVAGYDEQTAALGADEQARLAEELIAAADGFDVYGYFTSGVSTIAVASTTGLRAQQEMTDATAVVLAGVDGASGYAEQTSWRAEALTPAAVTLEAVEKAKRTRHAAAVEPGSYRAVLEPYAIAELLQYFSYDSFGALGLLEERSFLAGRLGERAFDERISIADDALDPRGLPKAFDFEGMPKQRVELVEGGVLKGVVWDRVTAGRAGDGHASTGHAPPWSIQAWGPLPFALSLAGGEAESTDELAELVGDGIYVTRIHYPGIVQPREGVITGMTRDGTFRIRDGRIAEPLMNLRFTLAVPELLADVPGLTRETTLVNQSPFYDERYPFGVIAPAIATARFDVIGVGGEPGI